MLAKVLKKNNLILLIPLLFFSWTLYLNHLAGPYSLTRCDPEYIYLMNGLNCANLDFNMIGHFDNPGTPIHFITGIFLRLIHLFSGQRPFTEDVLSQPDNYLMWASFIVSILTLLALIWLGRVTYKYTQDLVGTLIIQSSFLLNSVLIEYPLRYMPDRILIIYVIVLIIFTIKFKLGKDLTTTKYAVYAGILAGIGVASKFNFIPLVVLPFFLIPQWKGKLQFSIASILAFFLALSPIWSELDQTRDFFFNVATHDGLYGQGTYQIVNFGKLFGNIKLIFTYNPSFSIIAIGSLAFLIAYLVSKRNQHPEFKQVYWVLTLFLVAVLIGMIMVAKHFKNYYLSPVVALAGFVLFLLHYLVKRQYHFRFADLVFGILLVALCAIPFIEKKESIHLRKTRVEHYSLTERYINENITKKDYWFIEPTWLAGPMVENALAYGISWVAHRHELYDPITELYPHVLTWEGPEAYPKLFRTVTADPEAILYAGKPIYIYSSPGRNSEVLANYLTDLAQDFGTRFSLDTVFKNPYNQDLIIQLKNSEGWQTLNELTLISKTISLNNSRQVTDSYTIADAESGDYLEITVRVHKNDPENPVRLIARTQNPEEENLYFEDSHSLQDIGGGWQLLRLRGRLNDTPKNGQMLCQIYYPGQNEVSVMDLKIRHMGIRQPQYNPVNVGRSEEMGDLN